MVVSRERRWTPAEPRRRAGRKGATRHRPGSYTWPTLRKEFEDRLSRGESPKAIRADVRQRYADCPAELPADRTFRRWASEYFAGVRRDPSPSKPERKPPRPRPVLPVPVISRLPLPQLPMPHIADAVAVAPPAAPASIETAEAARPPPV
jgi:hypothetical protein